MMIQSVQGNATTLQKTQQTQNVQVKDTTKAVTSPITTDKGSDSTIVELSAEALKKSQEDKTETAAVITTAQDKGNTATGLVVTSSQGDTAEITSTGLEASQKLKPDAATDSLSTKDTELKTSQKTDAAAVTDSLSTKDTETTSTSSTEDTTNLSQYTETELKTLLTKGKITRTQYDATLEGRKANTADVVQTSLATGALKMQEETVR
ncbi:MAG: hypothetical protein WCS30_05645 [Selenomonadaceae bacterium]